MKVLSTRQPWGWAIVHAGKRIENRDRRDGRMPALCGHRGKLLLHVSGSMTKLEHCEAAEAMRDAGLVRYSDHEPGHAPVIPWPALSPGMPGGFHLGGIIGICDVIGHLTPDGWLIVRHGVRYRVRGDAIGDGAILDIGHDPIDLRWWGGGYALVLDNVRPVPFVRCKGARGLWDAPRDVLERIAT